MALATQQAGRYDLHSHHFFSNPESTFGVMREHDPIYFDPTLGAWILTRYEDVSEVLRSPHFSVDRNGEIGRGSSAEVAAQLREVNAIVSKWMVFVDPPDHTRLRGVLAKAFQPQSLMRWVPVIDGYVGELLDHAEERGSLEAMRDLGVPLAEKVTVRMLGLPEDSPARLKRWTENLFGFVGAGKASDELVEANAEGINACREFVGAIVRARRSAPGDDLVTQLLQDAGDAFTEQEIVGLVITLVAGAFETTAYAICSGLLALLRHPEEMALLRAEPGLIDSAVEEILRFDGPALSVQRRAKPGATLGGMRIPEGARVYCMLHAANHDPEVFSEPDKLNLRRSPCRHLGLGAGPHFCLGAWLTRLETRAAILGTIQRFPNLRLMEARVRAGVESQDPEWVANFAIRGLKELHLSTSVSAWVKRPGVIA